MPDEEKNGEPVAPVKNRRIVIETDGTNIKIISAEVAGTIEFIAILETLATFLKVNKQ